MAYKVGQKVRVREDIETMEDNTGVGITGGMKAKKGKLVTIKEVHVNYRKSLTHQTYSIKEDGWSYSHECFTPPLFNANEAFEALLHGSISDEEYEKTMKEIKNT